MPKPCPIHGKRPILVYPCCIGAQGGRVTTPAKRASSARNAAKARQAKAQQLGEPERPP